MWEIQNNNVDLDYIKTLILQEISKTQNQHQEEFCAFSEVTHLYRSVGCARNRHARHTVQQSLKVLLLMQVSAWTEFPRLSLGLGNSRVALKFKSQTMSFGIVSRLLLYGRSRRFKIDFRWDTVHSSTGSEIISLDAGLRTDGIPALDR